MLLIRTHLTAMRRVCADRTAYAALRRYFRVPGHVPLIDHLCATGHGQVDLVLALLRLNLLRHAERLVGSPIVRCPPCLLKYRTNGPPTVAPAPRVSFVQPVNPRVEPAARERFREFRVGRTVTQLKLRGITQREISWLQKNGWIRLETRPHV